MWCGHTPAEIDAMPARDFQLFAEAIPTMLQLTTIGGADA